MRFFAFGRDVLGRLPIVLQEGDDVAPWRQLDQVLLEPHKPVTRAAGNGLGFLLVYMADPKGMLLALEAKDHPPASVAILEACHDAPDLVTFW